MSTVHDEFRIHQLALQFADAANRRDYQQFQSIWTDDCSWTIGPPINVSFQGKAAMGANLEHMLGLWDFFVQITTSGLVHLDGDRAWARFYVQEVARGKDGKGNYNLSIYEDELHQLDGNWYFHTRNYHTIYQDFPQYGGLIQPVPPLPRQFHEPGKRI